MKNRRPANSGLSRIELMCIIILITVGICFAIAAVMYYQNATSKGDDSLKVKTCERVATVNLIETGSVISNRGGLQIKKNETLGYWDDVEKKVLENKVKGYNENSIMKIGKAVYKGKIKAMIIKVVGKNGTVKLSWVKGKE